MSLSLGPKRAWGVMDKSTSDHTHPPSRQQAAVASSRASSKATHAPSAKLRKQVNVYRTLRPLLGPPRPGPCIPPRGPTAGTSVVPMVLLVRCLGAGSCQPVSLAPKDHLTRLCDSVRPASSQVQGHPPHSSEGSPCPCLGRGITVLLAKDVMVPVPPADMKAWFFSPYIIVPKKSGGLRPILGLRILNWAFHKPPFKMLMQNRVFGCIRPQDSVCSI